MTYKFQITILTIILCLTIQTSSFGQEHKQHELEFDTTRQTIITYDEAGYLLDDYGYERGQFIQQDFLVIDSLITIAVLSHNQEHSELKLPHRIINLDEDNYRQQLVALTGTSKKKGKVKGMTITWGQKGVRYAWVNCFCSYGPSKRDSYWRTVFIQVDDGGKCYFNLMIDLTNKQYFDMEVNGR